FSSRRRHTRLQGDWSSDVCSSDLGEENSPTAVGDNPNLPRDPDKFDADPGFESQREFRARGVPSGLANEIFLDVYERPASFIPRSEERRVGKECRARGSWWP